MEEDEQVDEDEEEQEVGRRSERRWNRRGRGY